MAIPITIVIASPASAGRSNPALIPYETASLRFRGCRSDSAFGEIKKVSQTIDKFDLIVYNILLFQLNALIHLILSREKLILRGKLPLSAGQLPAQDFNFPGNGVF